MPKRSLTPFPAPRCPRPPRPRNASQGASATAASYTRVQLCTGLNGAYAIKAMYYLSDIHINHYQYLFTLAKREQQQVMANEGQRVSLRAGNLANYQRTSQTYKHTLGLEYGTKCKRSVLNQLHDLFISHSKIKPSDPGVQAEGFQTTAWMWQGSLSPEIYYTGELTNQAEDM